MTAEASASRGHRLVLDQAAGIIVQSFNDGRVINEGIKLAAQDAAFDSALNEINKVRDTLSRPQNILGPEFTKHGEIAENMEVGIRNARQALSQEAMTATFEGVHRTGPVDYRINGIGVQSKFINGVPNNLRHVLKHMGAYPEFTSDGSFYIIPKDTHSAIQTLLNGGHIEGLSSKSEEAIRQLAKQIEQQAGKPFTEVVQPSVSDYSDVQIVRAPTTLDNEQKDLISKNEELKDKIVDDHKPSLQGAAQAALMGGAVGGTLSLTTCLYAKLKAGKNVFRGDFTAADWQEVGVDTAKGAIGGSVAAGAIYLTTNYAGMAAPLASAVVSAATGIASLSNALRKGDISFNEFVETSLIICAESAIVGVATVVGQVLIPIPILGAVIGSLAGKLVIEFTRGLSARIAQRLRDDMDTFRAKLDDALKLALATVTAELNRLGSLTTAAFDVRLNTSLIDRSVELALAMGVKATVLIASEADLDSFMTA
ncbi:hypothetical protein FHR90_003458 [Endobacter medicaginis]|uniref:Uncharacterized protein n=1 Tax=Endobacter medicaginis TaxID=1181271 RepID=A0A850NR05_9PROT|nr:hypothetical protein [Endobacter medicaginis]MBB3175596.1 hypothetical protein [Endobacter medicaginis]MCX5477121.1 hypothetical protein [Endobacter medicaginis]NVN31334.1 hypothetical protein [Endobacter medicaginis]